MKLIIDASFPIAVAIELRNLGVKSAQHVAEIGLAQATADDVLAHARSEQESVVVTSDDLEPVLWRQGEKRPSILRMLAPALDEAALAQAIRDVAMVNDDTLSAGGIVTTRIGST